MLIFATVHNTTHNVSVAIDQSTLEATYMMLFFLKKK